MVANRNHVGDLNMSATCLPNPVGSRASRHRVDFLNSGYDTYLNLRLVVSVRLATANCSIFLAHGNLEGHLIPGINLGCLPSGAGSSNSISVIRNPTGTNIHETIRATVEFTSDLETDPLDDEPILPYTCNTEVHVQI